MSFLHFALFAILCLNVLCDLWSHAVEQLQMECPPFSTLLQPAFLALISALALPLSEAPRRLKLVAVM